MKFTVAGKDIGQMLRGFPSDLGGFDERQPEDQRVKS